ncbi:unnamed protein product [Amoebophrya sp. A25]|nr:unnamed protein product [Amoebophrya sp. A25]|eukprot:GSA25T00002567001.1
MTWKFRRRRFRLVGALCTCTHILLSLSTTSTSATNDCKQEGRCSSPGILIDTTDCWAGGQWEPCACSVGEAVLTGNTRMLQGETQLEYTCCLGGLVYHNIIGERCGAYGAANASQLVSPPSRCSQLCSCRSLDTDLALLDPTFTWTSPLVCSPPGQVPVRCTHGYKDVERCGHTSGQQGIDPLPEDLNLNILGERSWCANAEVTSYCPGDMGSTKTPIDQQITIDPALVRPPVANTTANAANQDVLAAAAASEDAADVIVQILITVGVIVLSIIVSVALIFALFLLYKMRAARLELRRKEAETTDRVAVPVWKTVQRVPVKN